MRLTLAEVSVAKLKRNFEKIRKAAPESKIMAIVKANAYGAGMVEISRRLDKMGAEFFGVAFAGEAETLRQNGIEKPILVLVPPRAREAELFCEYDLQTITYSKDVLRRFSKAAAKRGKTVKTHLFIDTGMRRDGIKPEEAVEFMKLAEDSPGVEIVGICTHFADSPNPDRAFTLRQLDLFNKTKSELESLGYVFEYVHAANSGAIFNVPEARFNLVRPGISLYGYAGSEELERAANLEPIMGLKTRVLQTRRLKKGDTVGYGMRFIADKDMNIAVLPIGYGDGLSAALFGKANCLICGRKYRLIGTICMDQCMVDLGDEVCEAGKEAVLLGESGEEFINAYDIAKSYGTIPYEVLTAISARVPRVYVDE